MKNYINYRAQKLPYNQRLTAKRRNRKAAMKKVVKTAYDEFQEDFSPLEKFVGMHF